ncbi:permease prefix domain 1-containing protein [Deinococcus ruber]|uniref:Uncharacterized protein n=1 Tax=Deinococcus ruber TaxID=1848197 RepID=A0A918BX45_9DEIO|nr:permease prefix domain 1-containing protein [Deinococcus ruber]GGQ96646.1 hypothetical protein GCM10008957_06140 [Deinococcus ruber]
MELNSPQIPSAVAAYLRRAAPRNAALRAELHANLHQCMLDHLTAGLAQEAAWEAALRDFGPASSLRPISRLSWRVLRVLVPLTLLGGAAYAAHLGVLT